MLVLLPAILIDGFTLEDFQRPSNFMACLSNGRDCRALRPISPKQFSGP
jgi:hypothetical protein